MKLAMRSIDIGYKSLTVGHNHAVGMRPFGDNEPPPFRMPDAEPVK